MNNKLTYRPDIDGLRAVAVLSVIIFHLNPSWLPGGFIGVDIFFVISGYLITSIIYHEVKENKFSFQNFYTRRIKRILPVFYAVVLISLIFGFIVMLPDGFKMLTSSAFSALIFLSNIYFTRSGGYFENTDQYPLLHTWSLSVEEQYYLVWPIILILFFKFGLKYKKMLLTIVSLMVASFVGAQILASSSQFSSWAYYLLPTRAGELLIGSVLAFLHTENNREYFKYTYLSSIVGAVLIILSLVLVNKGSVFPGINAFWPTLGAGLVIYGAKDSIINKFLALKPIVFIGLISYSLYLWHWPVLAFLRYIYPSTESKLPANALIFAAVLIALLSVISYYFIEQPTRKMKLNFSQAIKYYVAVPSSIILVIFAASYITKGFPSRFESNYQDKYEEATTMIEDDAPCWKELKPACTYNDRKHSNKIKPILFHGDSHGGQFESFYREISKNDPDLVFHYLASNACTIARDIRTIKSDEYKQNCKKNRALFDKEIDKYNTVILASRWDLGVYPSEDYNIKLYDNYLNDLNKFINKLTSKGKKVIIMAQVPKYDINVNRNEFVTKRLGFKLKYNIDENYLKANKQVQKLVQKNKNVYFLDLNNLICNNGVCSPYDESNLIIYRDDDHLNKHGSKTLANRVLSSEKYADFKQLFIK